MNNNRSRSKRLSGLAALVGAVLLIASLAALKGAFNRSRRIWYVDADAREESNSGLSWNDAFSDLQSALDAASDGDEIWVAAGKYVPTKNAKPFTLGDLLRKEDRRYRAFQLKNGVAVYGGFIGGETKREQRDWKKNRTILTGDLDGDHTKPEWRVRENGRVLLYEEIDGLHSENSYSVFYHPKALKLNKSAVLDGFTITGGNANAKHMDGGGMYNLGSSPTVRNCRFERNYALRGGALANEGDSRPAIERCVFEENFSKGGGGAIYNVASTIKILDSRFIGNMAGGADGGGAICSLCSLVLIRDCLFQENKTDGDGGAVCGRRSELIVEGGEFLANRAVRGGAIYADSGGFRGFLGAEAYLPRSRSVLKCYNSAFVDNRAILADDADIGEGGAVLSSNLQTDFDRCRFSRNHSFEGGALAFVAVARSMVVNCAFEENTAKSGTTVHYFGGKGTIVNCSSITNTSKETGAIIHCLEGMQLKVYNSVLMNEGTSGIIFNDGKSDVTISHSCLRFGGKGWEPSLGKDGGGNILDDPKLHTSGKTPYTLRPDSPCVDAGLNDALPSWSKKDLLGNKRISNGKVDIGAVEFQAERGKGKGKPSDGK